MNTAKVYFTDFHTKPNSRSVLDKLRAMLEKSDFAKIVTSSVHRSFGIDIEVEFSGTVEIDRNSDEYAGAIKPPELPQIAPPPEHTPPPSVIEF